MIIKDTLHVAHGALGGCDDQRFIKSEAEQQSGDNRENRESAFHSASSTVSNSSRHATVNTTSYASSKAIQNRADASPVSTAVVALTMPSTAGMEIGNSNNGSMISRFL